MSKIGLFELYNKKFTTASLVDEKKRSDLRDRLSSRNSTRLIYQVCMTGSWDAHFFVTLWKTDDYEHPLLIKIVQPQRLPAYENGFSNLFEDWQSMELLTTHSIKDFIKFISELEIEKPEFIVPVLISAFEGEGREIYLRLKYGKAKKYLLMGGSCFSSFGIEGEDYSVDSQITKKEYLRQRTNHIQSSITIPEEDRERHIWIIGEVGDCINDELIKLCTKDQEDEDDGIYIEKGFSFNNLSTWDKELHHACQSFYNQHHFHPNILVASTNTYNRIDLVANTKPSKIKGDGSEGMPVNPDSFVSLSGFNSGAAQLDFCIDDQMKELTFKLIYDSGPGGGEFKDEDQIIPKVV